MYSCVNEFEIGVNDSIFSGNEPQKGVKDVDALERAQRKASKCALSESNWTLSHDNRLVILKWPSLEQRRKYILLVEHYKCLHNINGLLLEDYVNFVKLSTRTNHKYKTCWVLCCCHRSILITKPNAQLNFRSYTHRLKGFFIISIIFLYIHESLP